MPGWPQDADEHITRKILCYLCAANAPVEICIDAHRVPVVELGESIVIVVPSSFQQLLIASRYGSIIHDVDLYQNHTLRSEKVWIPLPSGTWMISVPTKETAILAISLPGSYLPTGTKA